jgi:hypothetical protein
MRISYREFGEIGEETLGKPPRVFAPDLPISL